MTQHSNRLTVILPADSPATSEALTTPGPPGLPRTAASGPCAACHRVATLCDTTSDCACRVCAACGDQFLRRGGCAVCGVTFAPDEPWGDDPRV